VIRERGVVLYRTLQLVLVAACASVVFACGAPASTSTRDTAPAPGSAEGPRFTDADLDAAVDAYMVRAAALEPALTAALVAMAEARGGQMYKLEYRRKSPKSTRRKIHKILTEHPELTLAGVEIDDTVRYTMLIEDAPPGHHDTALHDILADLEGRGHAVIKVKNYWPQGDNYSGVNSVLRAPSSPPAGETAAGSATASGGLAWELQFHTAASVETNGSTRDMYEEMRLVTTALERQQALFDQMSARWEDVPIPHGILTPGSLHATEKVIDRPRPE